MPAAKAAPKTKKTTSSVEDTASLQAELAKQEAKLDKAIHNQLTPLVKQQDVLKTKTQKAKEKSAALKEKLKQASVQLKAKKTEANSKKVAKAKEALGVASKTAEALQAEAADIKVQLDALLAQQKKKAALKKLTLQFEKDWLKKRVPAKKKVVQKKAKKMTSKAEAKVLKPA